MYSCKYIIILFGVLSTQLASAVDLPSSVAFTQTHSFPNGLKLEVTQAVIDENDESEWVRYFQKELSRDLKANPNLKTFYQAIETVEEDGPSRSTSGSKRINEFLTKVANNKVAIQFQKFVTGKAYAEWKLRNKDFIELNKVRIQATQFRFLFIGGVITTALLVSDNPIVALSAIAGGALVGALSGASAWWFDFIADKVVGEPKFTQNAAEKLQNSKISAAMTKLKLDFLKSRIYKTAAWIEDSVNWSKVEVLFLVIIKAGFVALGIEQFDGFWSTAIDILISAGLGTLSQGEWERSIFYYRKQLLTENVDPITIQKRSQYLAIAGSILSVFGTVTGILHLHIAGYSPGTAVLFTLGAAGVIHKLVRIHETKLIELGKKIANRCAAKIEEPKKGIKTIDKKPEEKSGDQSSIWVISPVACSV